MKRGLLVLLLLLAGCPHGHRHTLVPDVPTSGNATARARFEDARAKFLRDGSEGPEFAQIVQDFPQDPIVPFAQLYAGMASLKARDFASADKQFAPVTDAPDAGLALRARMFLGITKNYEGDAASARRLLAGTDKAIENDDERTEWLAAVAYSTAAGDKPLAALPVFDQLWDRVTPAEKAVILARVEDLVAAADPNVLARIYDELADRKGPSIAIVGSRLILIAEAAGDAGRGSKLRVDLAHVRADIGLPATITGVQGGAAASNGNPGLVGAVIPIGSKKESRVAEAAIAGLSLAAGAPTGKGVAAIETRKAVDQSEAAAAVDELAGKNVVAIIGPIEGASVDAAAARAGDHQVPLISLATAPEQRATGPFVFHVRHSAEARARTLAQRALAKGIKTFAVLAPDNGYGKAVGGAFAEAIAKGGGTIVKTITYAKGTKSFAEPAAQLGTSGWQAVFVPDQAEVLGLIAPALAATGNLARPLPFPKKVIGGRPIMLLSTAEDLNDQYLVNAGRHSEGALLAPGFYPDDDDPKQKPFVAAYRTAYGHSPAATDAYAYDAAELVAAGAAGGRSGLAQTLATGQLAGVTGAITFDKDHRRADPGVIYTVVQETGGVYAIRVAP